MEADLTRAMNDHKFCLSSSMLRARRTSGRHAEWLLQHASSISAEVGARVRDDAHRTCLWLEPLDEKFMSELRSDLAEKNASVSLLPKLVLHHRIQTAESWLQRHPSAVTRLARLFKELSICTTLPAPKEAKEERKQSTRVFLTQRTDEEWTKWVRAGLTLQRGAVAAAAAGSAPPVSSWHADILHVCRWVMIDDLRRAVRRLLVEREVVPASEVPQEADPGDAELKAENGDGVDDDGVASTLALDEREFPYAWHRAAPAATPADSARMVFLRTAQYNLYQMGDQYGTFLWQRLLSDRTIYAAEAAAMLKCKKFDDPNRHMVNAWTIPFIPFLENVFYTLSDDRKKTQVISFLAKRYFLKSVTRNGESDYVSDLGFDIRQRTFAIKISLCALLGNYPTLGSSSHPALPLRYYLLNKYQELPSHGDPEFMPHPASPGAADFLSGAAATQAVGLTRLWDWLIVQTPKALLHYVQLYILHRVRHRPVIDRHRSQRLHKDPEHAVQVGEHAEGLVHICRRYLFSCHRHLFKACPWAPHSSMDTLTEPMLQLTARLSDILRPHGSAMMVVFNYRKVMRRPLEAFGVSVSKIAPRHPDVYPAAVDALASAEAELLSGLAATKRKPDKTRADQLRGCSYKITDIICGYLNWRRRLTAREEDAESAKAIENRGKPRDELPVYVELGKEMYPTDVPVDWGIRRSEFEVIRDVIEAFPDAACPRPDLVMIGILEAMGSPDMAIRQIEHMLAEHRGAKKPDASMRKFAQTAPWSYSRLTTAMMLWKRKTQLKTYLLSEQQRDAQLAAVYSAQSSWKPGSDSRVPKEIWPQSVTALFCRSCLHFGSSVRDLAPTLRQPSRLAANNGFPNTTIDIKVPSGGGASIITPSCNGPNNFDTWCCRDPRSLRSVVTVGKLFDYRGECLINCCYPACGVLSTLDPQRSSFLFGSYLCCYHTLVHIAATITVRPLLTPRQRKLLQPLVVENQFVEAVLHGSDRHSLLSRLLADSARRSAVLAEADAADEREAKRLAAQAEAEDADDEVEAARACGEDVSDAKTAAAGAAVEASASSSESDDVSSSPESGGDDDDDGARRDSDSDGPKRKTKRRKVSATAAAAAAASGSLPEHLEPLSAKERYERTKAAIKQRKTAVKAEDGVIRAKAAALTKSTKRAAAAPRGRKRSKAAAPVQRSNAQ